MFFPITQQKYHRCVRSGREEVRFSTWKTFLVGLGGSDRQGSARLSRDNHVPGFGQRSIDGVQKGGAGRNYVGAIVCLSN